MKINSISTALIKAYVRKIEELESLNYKDAFFLDEFQVGSSVQKEIDFYEAELFRICKKLNVVFKSVAFVLVLILVYISSDNSKIVSLCL